MLLDLPGCAWCPVSVLPPGPGLVSGFSLLDLRAVPGVRFLYWISRAWPAVWFFFTGPPGPGLVSGFSGPRGLCLVSGFFALLDLPGCTWCPVSVLDLPGLAWCPVSALVELQRQDLASVELQVHSFWGLGLRLRVYRV